MTWALTKIVSGGQTGVDRAALDLALELGIPCGGWCPPGRMAEDGPIDARYPLQEVPPQAATEVENGNSPTRRGGTARDRVRRGTQHLGVKSQASWVKQEGSARGHQEPLPPHKRHAD